MPARDDSPEPNAISDALFSRRALLGIAALAAGTVTMSGLLRGEIASAAPMWGHPFTSYAPITPGRTFTGQYPSGHAGIDYAPGEGTTIHAVADGWVVFSGLQGSWVNGKRAFGESVNVQHSDGYLSLYAHMQVGTRVAEGTSVRRGDYLGRVGNTGNSFGAHLHIELHRGGTPFDPYPLIDNNRTAPLAGVNPGPPPPPADSINGSLENLMYIRRADTGDIAVFGGSFRQANGGATGRHIFASMTEYNSWGRIVRAYNSEVRRLSLGDNSLIPEPPASAGDVLGVNFGDWQVVCAVYGV